MKMQLIIKCQNEPLYVHWIDMLFYTILNGSDIALDAN